MIQIPNLSASIVSIDMGTKYLFCVIAYCMREEGRFEQEPIFIEFGKQVIRKIYFVPLQFYSKPLILCSEPLNLKSETFKIY